MKEDICSIPVNEVFAHREGCPVCRMRGELEERALEFTLGAAMMEPDVRRELNRLGFCHRHFGMLCSRPNRLSLALVLESHLMAAEELVFAKNAPGVLTPTAKAAAGAAREAARMTGSCYVCERTERSLGKQLSTLFALWKKSPEFRREAAAQPCYCLPDAALLLERGAAALDKKSYPAFYETVAGVTRAALERCTEDMTAFCKMYDYHNNGADFGPLRDAVKNAVAFLDGFRTP